MKKKNYNTIKCAAEKPWKYKRYTGGYYEGEKITAVAFGSGIRSIRIDWMRE